MLLDLVTWNGTAINDGTNFEAYFPFGQPLGPSARPSFAARSRTFPYLAGKDIQGTTLSFHIICKGTIHSQYETIKAMFPIEDHAFRTLVVQDLAGSNKQWYVRGYAIQPPTPAGDGRAGEYVMTLALEEPLWRAVTAGVDELNVAASGDDVELTILGNHPAKPIFTLTIGAARAGGFVYRWWRPFYNPLLTLDSAEPLELTGGWDTSALIEDTSVSNQINQGGGISDSELSIPVDEAVGGGLNPAGGMCYVDDEQIYYSNINAGVMTVPAGGRGWGGTTAAVHADDAVMSQSQMQANGNDLRVMVNRQVVDAWVTGFGTADTKVWINLKYKPLVSLTLLTALGAGTITEILFKKATANATALKKLPSVFMLAIDDEVFLCATPNAASYKCAVLARGEKGTTPATHTAAAVVRHIEHDVYMMWGSPHEEAQEVDDTRKPMINLDTSTNTSWDWDEFADDDGLRTAGWYGALIASNGVKANAENPSYLYTATQGELADPATVIGIAGRSYVLNNVGKAESFTMQWSVYHPANFTQITASGNKRRITANWPATMSLFKSVNGTALKQVFKEATPAAAGSWGALTAHSGVALGTGAWKYLVFRGAGSLAATLGNEADMEFTDFTAEIASANVMKTPFPTFVTVAENSYYLDATLSITETGESIRLRGTCKVGSEIIVDCDAETLTVDGAESGVDIDWNSIRLGWLDLPSPKQSATCTLVYTEEGVTDVEIDITWENRNTL